MGSLRCHDVGVEKSPYWQHVVLSMLPNKGYFWLCRAWHKFLML